MQDGRCKTLDADADGYARGEACVTHLLEHFEQEQLKQPPAAAAIVVRGTAVNQDGRSSSLTVSIAACVLGTAVSSSAHVRRHASFPGFWFLFVHHNQCHRKSRPSEPFLFSCCKPHGHSALIIYTNNNFFCLSVCLTFCRRLAGR